MSKFDVKFEDNKLNLAIDSNEDGQPLLSCKINMSEAIQEAFKKGEVVEGAKVVSFAFVGTKLVLKLDTDKDGESVLDLEIDLMEAMDEVGLMKS